MPNELLMKPSPGMTKRQKGHRLSKGLVAHWVMNDRSAVGGTIRDYSGHNNTGTMVADTHFVSGRVGPALSFDGTGDYVTIDNESNFDFITPFSAASWFKDAGAVNAKLHIVGKSVSGGGVPFLLYFTSGFLIFEVRNSAFVKHTAAIAEGPFKASWHHVVGVYDSVNIYLYIDGLLKATTAFVGVPSSVSNNPVTIGARNSGTPDEFFDGRISSVQIYDRPLAASEVLQLYIDSFQMVRDPLFLTFKQAAAAGGNLPHTVNETWGW